MPSHGGEVSSPHDVVVIGASPAGEATRGDGEDLAVKLSNGRQLRPDALLFIVGRIVSTAGLSQPCACRPAPTGSEQAAEP